MQEYIQIEYLAPDEAIISNQAPEVEISTMLVIKWSNKMEGSGDNIYAILCGGLYKDRDDCLVLWSLKNSDAKMNCFTWSKDENDWIVPGDPYNEELKTGKKLSIMVNFTIRPSKRREIQRIHAPSIQDLTSLMALLEKEIHQ